MGRGSQQAQQAANTGNAASSFALGQAEAIAPQAQALYNTLAPELEAEAAHPAGFSPTDLAAANTAAQESAGGAESAAVGQGALKAARTRNQGGSDAAVAQSTRQVGQGLSRAALGTQMENARVKQAEHENALGELGGLYGREASLVPADIGATSGAIGATSGAVNANTNAAHQSWDWWNYLMKPILGVGADAAGAAAGGG